MVEQKGPQILELEGLRGFRASGAGVNILAQNDKLFPDGLSPDHKLFPQYKGRYKTEEPAYWIMFNVSMPIKIMEAEG